MPPNPAPGINPVALTYTSPPSPSPPSDSDSSTAKSIPHPEPISSKTYYIAGIVVTVYGLSELPTSWTEVGVLWLLHPRLQTQECMAPFAAHIIGSWNRHRQQHGQSSKNATKGLIAVSFDQRNHGSREVSALANEAWRGGNPTHAQDMFSCFQGTAADTSQLIDYLPGYVFPDLDERRDSAIGPHIALGVSLGGHAAWQCLVHDPRVTAAIVTIGCPDYERLMTDRARLSKRKTWLDGDGAHFIGSPDYPPSLVESVRRWDPAGFIFSSSSPPPPTPASAHNQHLLPIMQRSFGSKRILSLSGGADRLVPYKHSEPFLHWLKAASGKGGFFESGGLYVQDVVLPGVGHDVPPQMVEYMIPFVIDTLSDNSTPVGGRSGKDSRI